MKKFLSLILIATFFITHTTEVTAAAMSRNSTYTTLSTQYINKKTVKLIED